MEQEPNYEEKKDKEMLPDKEMNDPVLVPELPMEGVIAEKFEIPEVHPEQEKIWQGKWAIASPAPRQVPKQTSKKITKPPRPPRKPAPKKPVDKRKDTFFNSDNTAKRLPKKTEKQSNNEAGICNKSADTEIVKPSAMPSTDTEITISQPKYYTNFDFYYKRTSFRTMALFFKTAFNPFLEAWKPLKKTKPLTSYLEDFTKSHFPDLLESSPSEAAQFEF